MSATATASNRAPATAPAVARTPTLGARLRRGRTWLVIALVMLAGGGLLLVLRGFGGAVAGVPVGPADASPVGSKALVQVLRAQGVEVVEARTLGQAIDAGGADTTVLLHDAQGLLGDDDLRDLAAATDRLVVAAPDFASLDALAPGVRHAGAAPGALDRPGCDLPAAQRAGELSPGQRLFTIDDDAAGDGWVGCFADEQFGFAVAAGPSPEGAELALVGSVTPFQNQSIDESGNAALALGLLGAEPRLVWYLPGPADAPAGGPTLGELTPGWVSPVLVLAALVTVVAGLWRGRRLGRLVVEDLPVHVPAGETAAGRARLYAGAASRQHALDQIRVATIRRLATALRLPAAASVDDVIGATATALRTDPIAVRRLLVDEDPLGDARFVDLARDLDRLERDVRAISRPAHPEHPEHPEALDRLDRPDPPGRRP
ncbi:DUF4350 domain-containing protein [Agromyces sp. CFH 90414]|uniref:DUF4350 domain-containing protein n=1 Tax=Agromyces agglutinans TaxID=2662258 RepID=A0A6I2F8L7_9MICO|nr:DUF4350 domain-containing protein [Agromyces agglutinans]MRG60594.1 DUF4350 domain-containing protein [Agromyces agglutinans]